MHKHTQLGSLHDLIIAVKGAGEMASGVAWCLYKANFHKLFMTEIEHPLAVRRRVSFCEALYDGTHSIEGVTAVKVNDNTDVPEAWSKDQIPVVVDPRWTLAPQLKPDVVVDAILAKKNIGTRIHQAKLVIGLGPGFSAAEDVHLVIETNRGHDLGRIITAGSAEPNTGIPGNTLGYTVQRVLRAPTAGVFMARYRIGDMIKKGAVVGAVDAHPVEAEIDGVLRGLIKSDIQVEAGLKLGDIDPSGDVAHCHTISEKARAIGGAVLQAILRVFNQ